MLFIQDGTRLRTNFFARLTSVSLPADSTIKHVDWKIKRQKTKNVETQFSLILFFSKNLLRFALKLAIVYNRQRKSEMGHDRDIRALARAVQMNDSSIMLRPDNTQ